MSSKDNIVKQYDFYYTGEDNSLYNRRFGNKTKITLREQELLKSYLVQAIKNSKNKIINILDFGCGNGRIIPFLYKCMLNDSFYTFQVTAYDISMVGLQELSKNLVHLGFTSCSRQSKNEWVLIKNNVKIRIVLGNIKISPKEIEILLKEKFHYVICLYGTLSHIPGYTNRLDIIKIFKSIIVNKGILFLSLPTYASEKIALKQFDKFRKNNNLPKRFSNAIEAGDVYYRLIGSKDCYNFYHLYCYSEIKEQFNKIGVSNYDIGIYSTFSIPKISKNVLNLILDLVLCKVLSLSLFRNFAFKYFSTNFFISTKIEK